MKWDDGGGGGGLGWDVDLRDCRGEGFGLDK